MPVNESDKLQHQSATCHTQVALSESAAAAQAGQALWRAAAATRPGRYQPTGTARRQRRRRSGPPSPSLPVVQLEVRVRHPAVTRLEAAWPARPQCQPESQATHWYSVLESSPGPQTQSAPSENRRRTLTESCQPEYTPWPQLPGPGRRRCLSSEHHDNGLGSGWQFRSGIRLGRQLRPVGAWAPQAAQT